MRGLYVESLACRCKLLASFQKTFPPYARIHEDDSEHYTMIDEKHVAGFHETLMPALAAGGL